LLVVLSTFPVVIPFILMQDAAPALRVSNAIAITMLFVAGYSYGRFIGRRPWMLGIAMALLGTLLAALSKALGG
jgi:VIT1/CCC1 family predicted Fe2+/Mn2+ transporter